MRPERLSPRLNPGRDYLRALHRDATRSEEDRVYLETQARRLMEEFEGCSASEANRLRCALENLEMARDRSQPWDVRGPAADRASRILQGLGAISRRHQGKTIAPQRRRKMTGLPCGPGFPAAREDGVGEATDTEVEDVAEDGE